MTVQGYWADLPSSAFAKLPETTVAVLPIGATEQHGPHLPVNVDTALINAVTRQSLAALDAAMSVLVLPTLTITKSEEHGTHPGTLSLSGETLLAVLRDVAASVSRAGIRRLVLFNGHGGNSAALEIAGRDMRIAHEMIVVSCSWFGFADYDGLIDVADLAYDLHAGFIETSAMLAIHPEVVDMDLAADFRTAMEGWADAFPKIGMSGQPARPGWIIDDLNDQGACGNAAAASAAAGTHLLTTAATNFAEFLKDFAQFDHRASPK
ncbi:creatininase family protein [Shimia sp. Alg240-R146]|uniref:creatininase family protein n=1 Tax=Shimia sp. Alg240-R146 TaxID=2993449 RepID=UPI0022E7FA70|nr:creatininase family protein [Shimia sp. Alg240-R146]